MNTRDLRRIVVELLENNRKLPKDQQKSNSWLASEIVHMCEREFTAQIQDNLSRLFIDGDFASGHHSHTVE